MSRCPSQFGTPKKVCRGDLSFDETSGLIERTRNALWFAIGDFIRLRAEVLDKEEHREFVGWRKKISKKMTMDRTTWDLADMLFFLQRKLSCLVHENESMFAGPNKFQPRYTEMDVLHVIRNVVNLAVLLGDDNAALTKIQNDYKDLLIRDHPKRTSAEDNTRELQDDVIKLELAVRVQRLKRQLAEDKVATAKADAEAERYAAEAEEIAEKRKRKRGVDSGELPAHEAHEDKASRE
ncbi:hypothetical protein HDU88_000519 [Geranomyces variabilis]|nr:hypothetical protein HDU88_000519 [Geranomyces variabilis]